MRNSIEGKGPTSEPEEIDFMSRYAEYVKGLSDDELKDQREKHRWVVPNRAPSFYGEGDLDRQALATPSEIEQAKKEGVLIENELEKRGLVHSL